MARGNRPIDCICSRASARCGGVQMQHQILICQIGLAGNFDGIVKDKSASWISRNSDERLALIF